jgi:2-oxoisovalerate ferredoxin oxidoreductase beta subunit
VSSPADYAPGYTTVRSKARCFYDRYERKEELQHQTHYCPGCGHGIIHKMLARAIDDLGIQDRTVLVSPVGCSVFAYYYFDVGNVQAAHGRAPAVGTALKRSHPGSIVVTYQGDGDLSAIGSAEILHAANRGENITAIFVNNAIYSMTGGQAAPTTLLGQRTTTTPKGRSALSEGYPLRISELLATLDAPVYIARVGLGDNRQIAQADRAIRRAVETQVKGLGFSLVEVLSPCPTIWKMSAVEAQHWVRDVMEKTYPLGVLRDHVAIAEPRPAPAPPVPLGHVPTLLGIDPQENAAQPVPDTTLGVLSSNLLSMQGWETTPLNETHPGRPPIDLHVRIAGFGGQGVLLLGEVLTEAGLDAGLEASWLPSYGPEMRSGTSNCHVRLAAEPIDSPLVTAPNFLIAMNEPSLHKFLASVPPGGWVLYNGDALPTDCDRPDIHVLAAPFTQIADELGETRAANMVMLGALLEVTAALPESSVESALRKLIRHAHWLDLDRRALARGRALAHVMQEGVLPCQPNLNPA